MKYTIFGSKGFIGSNLVKSLEKKYTDIITPEKGIIPIGDLGHIIYCVGLTSDYRSKPIETINAHICFLAEILKKAKFSSITYLSSTRVYLGAAQSHEDGKLEVYPGNQDDIYNISKLAGESLCLSSQKGKVIRLSNVIGEFESSSPSFVSEIVKSAKLDSHVLLQTSLESQKDYILLSDVINLIPLIIEQGKSDIYNLASGKSIKHKDIINAMRKKISFKLTVKENASTLIFPEIDILKIQKEFNYIPSDVIEYIENNI